MTAVISLDDPQRVLARIDAYLRGSAELTGLDLYYELECSTSLLTFHTMLRDGPRNQARSGLQQSYGDHNRLLMLGLDKLVEGDLDWYRARLDPTDPVADDALRRCVEAVAALELSRETLVALWLAAGLHDCGMLCGRGAYVDVEDGVVLSRPIIDALCPGHLRELATVVLHHHDYVKGVFLGEVPVALVADDLAALPEEQCAVALAGLGCVQVAGAASLGEGRLGALRIEIFDRCIDGTALDDRSTPTRLAHMLGPALMPDLTTDAEVDRFLASTAVHGWHRVAGDLAPTERAALLVDVVSQWSTSGADHVVFVAGAASRLETTLSGATVLVLDR
jgi:hypothetical protein